MPPLKQLHDGKYKFNFSSSSGPYVAMSAASGFVEVYAQDLTDEANINVYQSDGSFLAGNAGTQVLFDIADILSVYDNFRLIERVVMSGNIADFDEYELIN